MHESQKSKTKLVLTEAPLGKKSSYINTYTPSLLFPLPRKFKRDELGLTEPLPFRGCDIWNGFELSWLNLKGKPMVAMAEFVIPCDSTYLIESKSFKLYLNSFNNSRFASMNEVQFLMKKDLSECANALVQVKLSSISDASQVISTLNGTHLDDLDIDCTDFLPRVDYLFVEDTLAEETLNTHLLKSNCLVTGQPDWGSVQISYQGAKINHEGFLKYIVSLRDHNEFHEQCVERIFVDVMNQCRPNILSIYARYNRRGGLDINPYRSSLNSDISPINLRLTRQ